jgi:hypothetical protein
MFSENVTRYGMIDSNVGTRKMAVSGFLQLLHHLDVKGMAVLSSSQSSQHISSPDQVPGRSLLTQVKFTLLQFTRKKLIKESKEKVKVQLYLSWGRCEMHTKFWSKNLKG